MRSKQQIYRQLCDIHKNGNPVLIFSEGKTGLSLRIDRDHIVLFVVASWGHGWDHVSVHTSECRPPTWAEMCFVKNLFWNPDETVVQYHPSKDKYKNLHPYCLHLWKPQKRTVPQPPVELV